MTLKIYYWWFLLNHDQVQVGQITKIFSWFNFLGKKSTFDWLCNRVRQKWGNTKYSTYTNHYSLPKIPNLTFRQYCFQKNLFCLHTLHCRFLVPDNTQKNLTEIWHNFWLKNDDENWSRFFFTIPRWPLELLLPSTKKSAQKGWIGLAG